MTVKFQTDFLRTLQKHFHIDFSSPILTIQTSPSEQCVLLLLSPLFHISPLQQLQKKPFNFIHCCKKFHPYSHKRYGTMRQDTTMKLPQKYNSAVLPFKYSLTRRGIFQNRVILCKKRGEGVHSTHKLEKYTSLLLSNV